jgi:hypothetical protein
MIARRHLWPGRFSLRFCPGCVAARLRLWKSAPLTDRALARHRGLRFRTGHCSRCARPDVAGLRISIHDGAAWQRWLDPAVGPKDQVTFTLGQICGPMVPCRYRVLTPPRAPLTAINVQQSSKTKVD